MSFACNRCHCLRSGKWGFPSSARKTLLLGCLLHRNLFASFWCRLPGLSRKCNIFYPENVIFLLCYLILFSVPFTHFCGKQRVHSIVYGTHEYFKRYFTRLSCLEDFITQKIVIVAVICRIAPKSNTVNVRLVQLISIIFTAFRTHNLIMIINTVAYLHKYIYSTHISAAQIALWSGFPHLHVNQVKRCDCLISEVRVQGRSI